MSAKTGVAPAKTNRGCSCDESHPRNNNLVPGPMSRSRIVAHNAADPLWQGTAETALQYFANSSPNDFACGPFTHLPLDRAFICLFALIIPVWFGKMYAFHVPAKRFASLSVSRSSKV